MLLSPVSSQWLCIICQEMSLSILLFQSALPILVHVWQTGGWNRCNTSTERFVLVPSKSWIWICWASVLHLYLTSAQVQPSFNYLTNEWHKTLHQLHQHWIYDQVRSLNLTLTLTPNPSAKPNRPYLIWSFLVPMLSMRPVRCFVTPLTPLTLGSGQHIK